MSPADAPRFPLVAAGSAGPDALRFDPDQEGDGDDSDWDFMELRAVHQAADQYTVALAVEVSSDYGRLLLTVPTADDLERHSLHTNLVASRAPRTEVETRLDPAGAAWMQHSSIIGAAGSIAYDTPFILTIVGDGTTESMWIDGLLAGSTPSSRPFDLTYVRLGYEVCAFELYEALLYARALDDEELDSLHAYLRAQYLD